MRPHSRLVDGGRDNGEADVAGSEGAGRELLTEHSKVHINWQEAGFPLEICRACHQVTSSDDAHRRVLDSLEFFDVGGVGVRKPDRAGVGEKGLEDGAVSGEKGLFGVSPGGACQGF